jgi:hypothetical protein
MNSENEMANRGTKMAKDKKDAGTDRRGFLKLASLGSLAGGAALVAGKPEKAEAATAEKGAGYRETDHVKAFYKSARF